MPRGGARPGAGRKPKTNAADASHGAGSTGPIDKVASAREWGLNALNSTDVPLETKVRIFGYMVGVEAKDQAPLNKGEAERENTAKSMTGKFAPRQVKGFGVVDGDKQ